MSVLANENDVERALLIPIQDSMTSILDNMNRLNNQFKIVIAGGRAIDGYLSNYLQNKLERVGYVRSFDYDLMVYPTRQYEQTADGSENLEYHPYYPGFDRTQFQPFLQLVRDIKKYYTIDGSATKEFTREINISFLSALSKFTDINHDVLETNLADGSIFVTEIINIKGKILWRIFMDIPMIAKPVLRIELVDLKMGPRHVQKDVNGNVVLSGKHNDMVTGETPIGGTYPTFTKRSYWNHNGDSSFDSVAVLMSPGINNNYYSYQNLYVIRPEPLLQDNANLVGDESDAIDILKKDYNTLFTNVANILKIPVGSHENIIFPFKMDSEAKAKALKDQKYRDKYIKRFIRVFCLTYMYIHFPQAVMASNLISGHQSASAAASKGYASAASAASAANQSQSVNDLSPPSSSWGYSILTAVVGVLAVKSYFGLGGKRGGQRGGQIPNIPWGTIKLSLTDLIMFFNIQMLSTEFDNNHTLYAQATPYVLINPDHRYYFLYGLFKERHLLTYSTILNGIMRAYYPNTTVDAATQTILEVPPVISANNEAKYAAHLFNQHLGSSMKYTDRYTRRYSNSVSNKQFTYQDIINLWMGNGTSEYWGHIISRSNINVMMYKTIKQYIGFSSYDQLKSNFLQYISQEKFRDTSSLHNDIYSVFRCMNYFAYHYANVPDQHIFTTYRYGPPINVIARAVNGRAYFNKLEYIEDGKEIYTSNILSSTCDTQFIVSTGGAGHAIKTKYSIYVFKLKRNGFLPFMEMGVAHEKEFAIPPFTKFKVVSREWKIILPISEIAKESVRNYRPMYVITLEQVNDNYINTPPMENTVAPKPHVAHQSAPSLSVNPPMAAIIYGKGASAPSTSSASASASASASFLSQKQGKSQFQPMSSSSQKQGKAQFQPMSSSSQKQGKAASASSSSSSSANANAMDIVAKSSSSSAASASSSSSQPIALPSDLLLNGKLKNVLQDKTVVSYYTLVDNNCKYIISWLDHIRTTYAGPSLDSMTSTSPNYATRIEVRRLCTQNTVNMKIMYDFFQIYTIILNGIDMKTQLNINELHTKLTEYQYSVKAYIDLISLHHKITSFKLFNINADPLFKYFSSNYAPELVNWLNSIFNVITCNDIILSSIINIYSSVVSVIPNDTASLGNAAYTHFKVMNYKLKASSFAISPISHQAFLIIQGAFGDYNLVHRPDVTIEMLP
jgi:hypothetical protein